MRQNEEFLFVLQHKGAIAIDDIAKLLDETDHYNTAAGARCYEQLFTIIVECIPDKLSCLITLLEHIDEDTCCMQKFLILLHAILLSLLRAPPSARVLWLEWALTTIEFYISKMKQPEDNVIESDEKKMPSSDPCVDSVLDTSRKLCSFFEALVDSGLWSDNSALAAFGFAILSGPLLHMYPEKFPDAMLIAESVVSLIDRQSCHVYRLFDWLDESRMTNALFNGTASEKKGDTPLSDRVPAIQLALYYAVKTHQKEPFEVFPCVYERLYLFHKILLLGVLLAQHAHNAITRHGLTLAQRFLSALEDGCIPHSYLGLKVHFEFVKSMSWVSTHSYIYENRQLAFTLLKLYLNKFTAHASYLLYTHVFAATENPDVDGEIVSCLRHKLFCSFNAGHLDEYQRGKRLVDMLRYFCRLEKGDKTDLLKYKSVILSTLHTFVLILGRDSRNETGVRDNFALFDEQYLKVLKSAVLSARNDSHAQINSLQRSGNESGGEKFNLVVEGEVLPPPKTQEKIESMRRDLRVMDMIEDAVDMVYTYANK